VAGRPWRRAQDRVPRRRRWWTGGGPAVAWGGLGTREDWLRLLIDGWPLLREVPARQGGADRGRRLARRAVRAAPLPREWWRGTGRALTSNRLGAHAASGRETSGECEASACGRTPRSGVVRAGPRRRSAERGAAQKCFTMPLFERKNLQKNE
jgi:hypothetical protein